eukprot:gb/GECG01004198.1/.p1 GENE.gb/GECG01004198.1/~~gb/GECG01004198.1/.p1  ORF type:complete len:747 (+),score=79.57 gb/GECG01004198.1/:1-2241(+)
MQEESKWDVVTRAEALCEDYINAESEDDDQASSQTESQSTHNRDVHSTLHQALELVKPLQAEIQSAVCFRSPGDEKKIDGETKDLYIRVSTLLENIYSRLSRESPCEEYTDNNLEWRVCKALLSKSFDEIREVGNLMWSRHRDFHRAWAYYTVAICVSGGTDTKAMCNRAVVAFYKFSDRRFPNAYDVQDNENARALYDGFESARRAYRMDPEYTKANLYATKCAVGLGLLREVLDWMHDGMSTCLRHMASVSDATVVSNLDSHIQEVVNLAKSCPQDRIDSNIEVLNSKTQNARELLMRCGDCNARDEMTAYVELLLAAVTHIVRTSTKLALEETKLRNNAPGLPEPQVKTSARHIVDSPACPPREEKVPLEKRLIEIEDKNTYFNGDESNLKTIGDMERGIRVVAQRNFQRGEEIQTDEPYFATTVFTDRLCEFCMKPLTLASSVRTCPGCKFLKYCSDKCHSDAWSMYHRVLCGRTEAYQKLLKKTFDEGVVPNSRMPLQVLKLMGFLAQCHLKTLLRCDIRKFRDKAVTARGLVEEVGSVNRDWLNYAPLLFAYPRTLFTGGGEPTQIQQSMVSVEMLDRFHLTQEALKGPITCKGDLPESYAGPLKTRQSEKLTNILQAHPMFGYRVYVQLEALLVENAKNANLDFFVPEKTHTGCTANNQLLLRSTAFLKHSCCPNVHEQPNMMNPSSATRYVAAERIRKGDQLTTTYVPLNWSRTKRRQQLEMVYGFSCTCPRCKASES